MQITLKAVADQTEAERASLRALTTAVYPADTPDTEPGPQTVWAAPTWGVLVHDDSGELASYVGIHVRDATVDGQPALIGGIGNVKTHPERRGRGHAQAALRRAMTFLADDLGAAFGLLVCRQPLIPFYSQLGWLPFPGTLLIEQHGTTLPFTHNTTMLLPLHAPAPHTGTIDLHGLPW